MISRAIACPHPHDDHDGCELHRGKTVSRPNMHSNINIFQLLAIIDLRNVARMRFRDSTRRVQKNHFGRRRLGILSRGLVNGTHHPAEEETATSGISGILLEHAQREISRPPISAPVHQSGARDAFNLDPSSSTGSTRSSNATPSELRSTHILENGSRESPRPLSSVVQDVLPKILPLEQKRIEFLNSQGLLDCVITKPPPDKVPRHHERLAQE